MHVIRGIWHAGVFSMSGIRAAIDKAVQEASQCDEEEKRRRIKQLQLRWHPDKVGTPLTSGWII